MGTGVCGIWALKAGDYVATEFDGSATGLAAAITYVGSNGLIQVYPGNSTITIPTIPAGIVVIVHEEGKQTLYGGAEVRAGDGTLKDDVHASDYADVQAAMSAVPPGGRLYIDGDFTVPSGGLIVDRAVEIFGSGSGSESVQRSILRPFSDAASQPVIKLKQGSAYYPDIGGIVIRDLSIIGAASSNLAGAHGIDMTTVLNQKLLRLTIERVNVAAMGDDGIHLEGFDAGASALISITLNACKVDACWGRGLYVFGATVVNSANCYFLHNKKNGAKYDQTAVNSFADAYEDNCTDVALNASYDGQLYVRTSGPANLFGGHFEGFTTASQTCKRGVVWENTIGMISGCIFVNGVESADTGQRGIYLENSAGGAAIIGCNTFHNCLTAIESNFNNAGCSIFPQTLGAGTNAMMNIAGVALSQIATASLSTLTAGAAGQICWDLTTATPAVWTGSAWKHVTIT